MRAMMTTAVLFVFALSSEARADSILLPTSGPSCYDHSNEAVSLWNCSGPSGYTVTFADEGNMVAIGFAKARLRVRHCDSRNLARQRQGLWRQNSVAYAERKASCCNHPHLAQRFR